MKKPSGIRSQGSGVRKSVVCFLLVLYVISVPCFANGERERITIAAAKIKYGLSQRPQMTDEPPNVKLPIKVKPGLGSPEPAAVSPHKEVSGLHSHWCAKCKIEWWHGPENLGAAVSHQCPKCHALIWDVHQEAKAKPVAKPTVPVFQSGSNCPGGVCPAPRRGLFGRDR